MRHKTALQHQDGGWHYVNAGRDGGYPLGYCHDHPPHVTEEEARDCYGRYLREQTIKLNASKSLNWGDCQECGAPTKDSAHYGDDGYGYVALCPEHMSIENVIKHAGLDGPAGDSWIS